MAPVRWSHEGLDDLDRQDAWRTSRGWVPVAHELMGAVESYFARHDPGQPPHLMPGRTVRHYGEDTGARVVTINVRSKPFRVFFRYHTRPRVFEVLGILHPRAQ